MDRKGLAVKSSFISLSSKLLSAVLAFICRKYFLDYLGADLLGVSGTITQVLEALSLAELGFQTAIIFQLYKPLSDKNYTEISSIVMLLRKVYCIVGMIVLIAGIILIPFLHIIITRVDVDFGLIYIVYLIMLFGTSSSYFLAYNRALLQADQKIYVNNIIDSIFLILSTFGKIIAIVNFRSFLLYALIGTIGVIGSNIFSYIYYRRNYYWIDKKAKADKRIVKSLVDNTKDVFAGRIAGFVYSSTDNIVISALLGTKWVGLVGNYSTITNALKMLIFGLTAPIQPMLGNYAVTKSKYDTERIMLNYGFIKFVIALFLLVPTIVLSDMFICLFYGEQYVQSIIIIVLLSADLFIVCLQGAVGELIDAVGFFKKERNLYIVYAIFNLVLSCVGAKIWGIIPVFAATVFSQMVGWFWRSVIAYKYYFSSKSNFLKYWMLQIKYTVFFVFVVMVAYLFKQFVLLPNTYFGFILYGIFIEIIVGLFFVAVYHKHEGFKYISALVKKLIWRS